MREITYLPQPTLPSDEKIAQEGWRGLEYYMTELRRNPSSEYVRVRYIEHFQAECRRINLAFTEGEIFALKLTRPISGDFPMLAPSPYVGDAEDVVEIPDNWTALDWFGSITLGSGRCWSYELIHELWNMGLDEDRMRLIRDMANHWPIGNADGHWYERHVHMNLEVWATVFLMLGWDEEFLRYLTYDEAAELLQKMPKSSDLPAGYVVRGFTELTAIMEGLSPEATDYVLNISKGFNILGKKDFFENAAREGIDGDMLRGLL